MVRSARRYFPWRLTSHYALRLGVFAFTITLCFVVLVYQFVSRGLEQSQSSPELLGDLKVFLFRLAFAACFLVAAFIVWSSWFYFRPVGRLLRRARELRRVRQFSEDLIEDDFTSEDPGEWEDLDRAVRRLHSDLRQKTDQLGRESEELSVLISAVSNAILAIDFKENPLFFNSQFAHLFGVPQNAQGEGYRLGEIFRSPDVLSVFREVLATGQAKTASMSLNTAQSGAMARDFTLSVAPLRESAESAVYGAVGSFNDITELKQAERIRIEFVGNASHELRTPLTNIKGYLATVVDDFKAGRTSDSQEFLNIISSNVDRLIYLVNDLLDLSSIESGSELEKSLVHTRELTETVLKALEQRRARKQIEIKTIYNAETLMADPQRVEQVLVNLVHNALKYIPEHRQIEIRWTMLDDASVRLSVKDNGPGISSEHLPRLFERFYRIDPGRSRDQGGTGLGLSIVKHIMLKHGGTVRVESKLGEGAEFICWFPAKD